MHTLPASRSLLTLPHSYSTGMHVDLRLQSQLFVFRFGGRFPYARDRYHPLILSERHRSTAGHPAVLTFGFEQRWDHNMTPSVDDISRDHHRAGIEQTVNSRSCTGKVHRWVVDAPRSEQSDISAIDSPDCASSQLLYCTSEDTSIAPRVTAR